MITDKVTLIAIGNLLLSLLWLTWWVKLLIIFIAATGAFIFHRIKINALKNEKADLRRQVHERNELLSYANRNEQKARQEADLSNKNKSVLLSKISHEIRTPMNAVMGMTALLNETSLTAEQQEYTASILNSGESLLSLISDILMKDILEYSKVDSGNELEAKDFNLRNCIEEVLDVFAAKAADAGLDLVYCLKDNVPEQIIGDALRLRQVLMNLVENAFRFIHKGEIFIGVDCIGCEIEKKMKLEFEVRDSGVGMRPEVRELVSKDLSKPESEVNINRTIGLGLIICKRLVSLMGGTIKIESRENEGTSFKFTIITGESQQFQRANLHTEMGSLEGKKILIADDNLTLCYLLKSQLEQWKMMPSVAKSGKEALELLSQDPRFDLVIADMHMPEMNGIQLARSVRQQQADLPVILLNKTGDESYRQFPELFISVINKPIRQHILSQQLLGALRHNSNESQANKQSIKQKLSVNFSKQYPLRILVAEDDAMNQQMVKKVLSKLGYDPNILNNGQEVLEEVSVNNYDLILMDVQMPQMDGLEATRMIRLCLNKQPVIIAMTANILQGDREECLRSGMDDYISKPVKLEELVNILEKWSLQSKQKV